MISNNRVLISMVLVSILFILLYKLSLLKTVNLISEYNQNIEHLNSLYEAPSRIIGLKNEIKELNYLINSGYSSKINRKKRIIDITENECQNLNLSIVEINEPLAIEKEDYTIAYNKLVVEGEYFNMIKFIHSLENKKQDLSLISVKIYSKKIKYVKKTKLYTRIIFQTIKYKNKNSINQ